MSSQPSRTVPALIRPPGAPIEELSSAARADSISVVPAPPVAKIVPRPHTIHGETRIDEYFWLRNREDPEVLAYLEAENRYTEAVMRPKEALQERLFGEMRSRIREYRVYSLRLSPCARYCATAGSGDAMNVEVAYVLSSTGVS